MYRPDLRNDTRIFMNAVHLNERLLLQALSDSEAIEAEARECAEAEAYAHAARHFGESVSWVRAHHFAFWQDKSMNIVAGRLLVFGLLVDGGGFDPMPIC